MSNNNGIPAEDLSQASLPAVATAIARISVATAMKNLINSVIILALLQVGSLPHDTWIRARANFEELKCTCGRIADTRLCMTIELCRLLARKGTGVGGDARAVLGTYEQPSTGIAIRWHTKSVIPIAKGAKTCKTIDTSIMIPYNTMPST